MLQGDRRANVDLLETHKKLNGGEIATLREENKTFRSQLAQMKRKGDKGEGGGAVEEVS